MTEEKKRIAAIGDIHGEYDKLVSLIDKIEPTPDDLLIFLGDYVDRGLKSRQVLDFLITLENDFDCVFLRGNHEKFVLDAHKPDRTSEDVMLWMYNGGGATIDSYRGFTTKMPKEHLAFIEDTKLIYETSEYVFVHAGINPEKPLTEQTEEDLLWIREKFILEEAGLSKKVIYGHTPEKYYISPFDDKICLDNHAFRTENPIKGIILPKEELMYS